MNTVQSFRRILLATDGSEQSAAAAGITAGIAARSRAAVKVVHVWNLEVHHRHGYWDVEVRSEARKLIDSVIALMHRAGVKAEGEILHADSDDVASAVAGEARELDADLVVVGSRGLSDWQSMLRHSVSHQLLVKLDCPLLVVHSPGAPAGAPQRLLLAVAGGDDVAPAVAAAAAVASPGSKVLVVHVAQVVLGAQGYGYVEPEEEASATVARTVAGLTEAGISASGMVAHSTHVGEVVTSIAGEWDADLVVLGSSRMGDLASLVFGSVSHEVLHTSALPVLIAERVGR